MRTISRPGATLRAQALRMRELMIAFSRRRSLRDPIAASCADLDLSPVQIHSLLWLGFDGAMTMGEVARRVAVTEKTITGVVDRLERDGLVTRARDPLDRRVVHVRLSARGEQRFRRIDGEVEARLEGILSLLEPQDRRELVRILERLDGALGGPGAAGPRPAVRPLRARAPARAGAVPHPFHAPRREDT
jgi:DNA-binding MarR family transcriptional regulator